MNLGGADRAEGKAEPDRAKVSAPTFGGATGPIAPAAAYAPRREILGRVAAWLACGAGGLAIFLTLVVDGPLRLRLAILLVGLASSGAYWLVATGARQQAARADDLDQRLTRSLTVDPLTGLPNRTTARAWIDDRLARGEPTAVLVVDIDRLQLLTDEVGRSAAEAVVAVISERTRRAVSVWGPEGDWFVARGDDDEIIVVVSSLSGADGLRSLGEAVVAAASAAIALPGWGDVSVSASVGVSMAEEMAGAVVGSDQPELFGPVNLELEAESLFAGADLAVNEAKRLGRARVEILDEVLRESGQQRTRRFQDLRRAATRHGEIEVWAQPIVDLRDRCTIGAEALMRWRHPYAGVLAAGEFLAAAQEAGMIRDLGDRVLDQACAALARRAAPWMAVNLSTRELYDPSLQGRVQRALADNGVDPERLCLEVQEASLLDPTMLPILKSLESLGVGLAIDDFGVGASPLLQMQALRRPILKLDGSFVNQLDSSRPERATAMIGTFAHLAAQLGLAVVAEGVETEEQAEKLLDLGVPLAQGYLFGRPEPLDGMRPHEGADLLDERRELGPRRPPWAEGPSGGLMPRSVATV